MVILYGIKKYKYNRYNINNSEYKKFKKNIYEI